MGFIGDFSLNIYLHFPYEFYCFLRRQFKAIRDQSLLIKKKATDEVLRRNGCFRKLSSRKYEWKKEIVWWKRKRPSLLLFRFFKSDFLGECIPPRKVEKCLEIICNVSGDSGTTINPIQNNTCKVLLTPSAMAAAPHTYTCASLSSICSQMLGNSSLSRSWT